MRFFSVRLKERHEWIRNGKGLAEAWIQEMMVGMREIKLMNAQPKVERDHEEKVSQLIGKEIEAGYLALASDSVNGGLLLVGQLGIYCIAAFCVGRETMTVGQFVACAAYFSICAAYFNALRKKLADISANMVGIRRVEEFMSWEEEQDLSGAEEKLIEKGGISFDGVTFGYGEGLVLEQVCLEVLPGEKVAFVGRSGEGKSTLLMLLYRFYEPMEGRISKDGVVLTDYTLCSLRSQIAVVQQDNGLLHCSLRKTSACPMMSPRMNGFGRYWTA